MASEHFLPDFRPALLQNRLFDAPAATPSAASGFAVGVSASGLVPSKTTSHETQKSHAPHWEKGSFQIDFCKTKIAEKRVKRLKRNVWASGHLHGIKRKGFRPLQAWFVTLTYALADRWRPNHITKALERFRRWCARRGHDCKYTWVAEIQPKRAERTGDNVVHYHALIWLPVGVQMPFWDRATTNPSGRDSVAFWPHGMTNTEQAKSGVGYLMKYLSKLGELTVFPEGLRLYGMGGLDPLARMVRTWYNLPQWAKNTYGVGDLRRTGAGLIDLGTGEVLPPMYARQIIPGGIVLTLLRDYPERSHDGAYSSWPRAV